MIGENKKKEPACRMCGRCCSMEIPLTLLDIHRMAEFKGVDSGSMFHDVVQDQISERSSLYMIKKDEAGACLFLTKEKRCSIQAVKPGACRFFDCSLQAGSVVMPWTATCTDPLQRARLWEQSVAVAITKAYIEKNGPAWNETDYKMALKGIVENIPVRDTQKLKLARDAEGAPMALIYDCSECEKTGTCAKETPVTLDDIRRMASHLRISRQDFFRNYIAPEPSVGAGGLKLKRHGHCVFFHVKRHCTIEEVRPLHCRFTPCPWRTKNTGMMDALFLGSGTVEEQFRNQVALAMTRQYVGECGVGYNRHVIERLLKRIDQITADNGELEIFCKNIAPYRYVDDTLLILRGYEKR
jgi:Fe-S-cluster containining protein